MSSACWSADIPPEALQTASATPRTIAKTEADSCFVAAVIAPVKTLDTPAGSDVLIAWLKLTTSWARTRTSDSDPSTAITAGKIARNQW